MVLAKTQQFESDIQQISLMFKAMAHPARISILQFLANIDSCFSGDITQEIPLGRTTVNQHLAELKKAGLIKGSIQGSRTKYCINAEKVRKVTSMINELFSEINTNTEHDC